MLSDNIKDVLSQGIISDGIEVDSSIIEVTNFILSCLPVFAIKNKGRINTNEKGLTQRLCTLLNRRVGEHPFFFQTEDMEDKERGNSPQIDIGAFSESETITVCDQIIGEDDSFFKIEAKRLTNLGKPRAKEYLIGREEKGKYLDTGGVERFKKGIHGSKLKYSAIVGFVQVESFNHWFVKINDWVDELIHLKPEFWKEQDKLSSINHNISDKISHSISNNLRIKHNQDVDKIHLYHFWVDLK